MRILLHQAPSARLAQYLSTLESDDIRISWCDESDSAGFEALLPEVDVIWHVLRRLTRSDIERAPHLKLIQKLGVGVDTIDLAAARGRGVAVCNMPGINAQSVAEMTLLLMLSCLRRLPTLHAQTRSGRGWETDVNLPDQLHNLAGKVVGLVGYGAIPQTLSPMLRAIGATVLYTATAPKDGVDGYRSLHDLVASSDILSLHVPLTPATEGLIDRDILAAMRPGSILINTSRGRLVDQRALVDALRDGPLACAGLDVFAEEPVSADEPVLQRENVVLTPHVAWLTLDTMKSCVDLALENSQRCLRGDELLNRVA